MNDARTRRLAPIGLALGLLGLLAAAFIYLYQRQFDALVQSSLAVAALGFALAMLLNPGAVQAWLSGRQARYGGNVLVMTLAFAGIVVLANYLAYKNPKQWDLTEDQTNTLAPETIEAIQQAPQPVTAIGFYSANFASSQEQTRKLLDRYKAAAPGKLAYEFHDPLGDPGLAQQYGITRDGMLILTMGELKEEISFAAEQEITGALIRFAHPTSRVVYFLTTHGERDIAASDNAGLSKVADLLKKQNYEVQPLNLQVTTTVPADARAVVIAGPLKPVTAGEVQALEAHLRSTPSTALVVLLDPPVQTQAQADEPDPLADYLRSAWGIDVRRDVIVDPYNSYPGQPFFPLNNGYESSPITNKLQRIATVFPVARSVAVMGTSETMPGITYTPLVKTDERAWGETDVESLQTSPALGEGDNVGPLNIAVAAENTQTKSRLVVFGDSDFAGNDAADQGANAQLLLNSLSWATTEESLINVNPKIPTTRTVTLTSALTANLIFLITVIVMPLVVVALGGVVWFVRRRRHV